jgi:predicted dinucleotide-binding enzyme
MDIAIVGTGSVGSTLGRAWATEGHDVVYGSRDPDGERVQSLVDDIGDRASVTTPEAAASAGEVILLAVPGTVVVDVVESIGDAVAGKPVLDATNSMDRTDESLAERVAASAPEARVAKAFNTIGTDGMRSPEFRDGRATMFLAGDDPDAKAVGADLARDIGFEAVDCGDLDATLMLEDLARLWVHLSTRLGRDIGFKLLRD